MKRLVLQAIEGLPEIRPGDDLAGLLAARVPPGPGVLVVAQKIVSKAEGRLVPLSKVVPTQRAIELAREIGKEPAHVQLVLDESRRIVRVAPGVLITETRHGLICANSGVDLSNAPDDDTAILLPLDPDASARAIRERLGPRRGVILSDTFGRPWREGLVDVAIGVAGLAPVIDSRGTADRRGRELQVTIPATADALAAAAGLLMKKADGVPAVWMAGVELHGDGSARQLIRDAKLDLFR